MFKEWLAKFKKNIFFCWLLSTLIFAFYNSAFAEATDDADYVSTNQIMQEIEKTLLFSSKKTTPTSNNFYQSETTSDVVDNDSANEDDVDVSEKSTKSKKSHLTVNQKQTVAYNALNSGQYEVAIALYKQVLAVNKHDDYTKFALAATYQRLGQFKQAKALYYELLKAGAKNRSEIINNLLSIIVEESPREAIYLLSKLATDNPDSAYIFAECGMAYSNVKNYDQAIYFLNRAIYLDPKNNEYKFNLAVVYDYAGDYEKALMFYQEALTNYNQQQDLNLPVATIHKRIDSIKNKLS